MDYRKRFVFVEWIVKVGNEQIIGKNVKIWGRPTSRIGQIQAYLDRDRDQMSDS